MHNKIELDKDTLANTYQKLGSLNKVAKALDCSAKTIKRRMKELDLHYEPKKEYSCDDNFFSIDGPEQLYWAGFLGADGNVTHRNYSYILTLGLATKDKPHIEKFKLAMKSNHPIHDFKVAKSSKQSAFVDHLKQDYYYSSYLVVTSKQMFEDLAKYNIVPAKTYVYTFPEWLKTHSNVHHFVRGLIDGDGWSRIHDGQAAIGFCGMPAVVSDVRKILVESCGLENNGHYYLDGYTGNVEFCGNHIVAKIFDWLYRDATSDIYLERKYNNLKRAKELKQEIALNLDKDKLAESYNRLGTFAAVAREFDCDQTVVKDYMEKYDLSYNVRDQYKHNEEFFAESNESEKQFYWAGYLSGKSSVRYYTENNVALELMEQDIEHLEKFKHDIESNAPITNANRISIFSKKICEDLERFGIDKNKFLNYKIPEWLKKHPLLSHFLRGRLDARSSLSAGSQILLEITGSVDFLNDLIDIFQKQGISSTAKVRSRNNDNQNRFSYTNKNVPKIIHYLYKDATIYLQRKYDIAHRIIQGV